MAVSIKNPLSRRLRRKDLRSPFRAKPLRLPGQSVDEEIERIMTEKVDSYAMAALGMIAIAVFEWFHVLADVPPMPALITAVAVGVSGYAVWRLFQLRRRIRDLKLGRDGERIFGQFLDDQLRSRGCYVLHDLRGGNWNIDHVVVSPQGIFTVETKTRSKPRRGAPVIKYDGESLTIAGWKPDRDPVAQAKAQASWLRETLARSLGLTLPVQPIVVFPGWFVESPHSFSSIDVWVLSGKELPSFVENSGHRIDPQTANTVSHFLRQMVRSG